MKRSRTREYKLIAGVLAVSGLVIAALAFLTPQVVGTSTSGAGTATSMAYTTLNMLLALLGGFMFAAGAAFILFKEDARLPVESRTTPEPQLPILTSVPPSEAVEDETVPPGAESKAIEQVVESPSDPNAVPEHSDKNDGHLVLRLLSGDERTVFRAITDAGGEMYQKDIVTQTKMSDAKVSRVLDRLEEKGVITKERCGMTNKVRIEIEE